MLGRDDLVHEAKLCGLIRREWAAVEHEPQGARAAEQASEALRAAASGREAQQDLGLADPVIALSHDAHVAGKGQLAAAAHRGAVQRGDEHGATAIHPQQGLVEALELQDTGRGGAGQRSLEGRHSAQQAHGSHRGQGYPRPERRTRTRSGQQLTDVVVSYEPLRVGAGEDYGAHVLVRLRPRYHAFEAVHDPGVHQPVRWADQRGHQHVISLLDSNLAHGADRIRATSTVLLTY